MPSELHIISANHLEQLADALATLVEAPVQSSHSNPLQPETVLVQSKGMQQWVSMAIAQRNGICANTNFPFPNAFLGQLYEIAMGELPQNQLFDPKVLTFRIMLLMPQLMLRNEFEAIRQYLVDPSINRKQYQLAAKIADVLDQYQIFRPEMILQWESGRQGKEQSSNAWQSILWRNLSRGIQSHHRAALQKQLITKLTQNNAPLKRLPSRISVFGISHLPPFHLQVLEALSRSIPVYLFLLNPCRHYWSDIVSDQQLTRSRQRLSNPGLDPGKDLHIERGNRLLASWGGQGKQFMNLIHQMDGQMLDLFEDNPSQTLLSRIQQDILDLNDGQGDGHTFSPTEDDRSIQVHVCHSPMREVEVLRDQLTDLFEIDSTLSPRDILVMTPDIESYAPYIHAVFKNPLSGEAAIPYTVADQGLLKESRLIEGFLSLLELHHSRFQVSHVMALLSYPHIRRRFQIEEGDLSKIERWLHSAHIRWGWDGAHRKSHTLPRFEQNTWRHGLDRLVLGYAMAGDGIAVFNGILPQEDVDSSDGQILGALSDYVEKLYRQMGNLPEEATISHWHSVLIRLLDDFLKVDETCANQMQVLRDTIDEFEKIASTAGFTKRVPFEVVHDYLKGVLNQASFGTGFMAGRITFCAMLPMRSIPAKVICILGMGYDAFPQDIREPAFNLIAAEPAAGDRSKRDDDKYLFLEALISARQALYLSYVGRSVQDNSPIPPSVVVDELLEYIETGFGVKSPRIVTHHPLQAFSKSYFNDCNPRIYSYSKENLEACQAMGTANQRPSFFTAALEAPDSNWRVCAFEQLAAFFTNPTRFLLEQRLGIYLRQERTVLEDHENFNLDALTRFKIKQKLFNSNLGVVDTAHSYESIRAAGMLPHGTAGQVLFHQIENDVHQFVKHVNQHMPDSEETTLPFDLRIGPFRLGGELDCIYPEKRIVYRFAKFRPQDLLSLFLAHLVMAADTPTARSKRSSVLVCEDAQWQLHPVSNPRDILHQYLDLFWQGLQFPIPLFPKSSYAYALKAHQGIATRKALAAAHSKWQGNLPHTPGEIQDPYLYLCFGDQNPFNDDFEKTALSVFRPLFSSAVKI